MRAIPLRTTGRFATAPLCGLMALATLSCMDAAAEDRDLAYGLQTASLGGPALAAALSARGEDHARPHLDPVPTVSTSQTAVVDAAPSLASGDAHGGSQLAAMSVRWWLRQGRSDLGLGVGTLGHLATPSLDPADVTRHITGTVPTMTVGWRYRMTPASSVFADASHARGVQGDLSNDYYNTKVGVEWKPAQSRLRLDGRSLGLHFDSGYRMSLRVKKGSVGVYMRNEF